MLDTYRVILRKPGALQFASAGLLSRLPMSMFNISVILMVQIQYDSYSMAGRVAAIGTLVWAIQTVPTARLVDRIGQRRAMIPLSVLFVVGAVLERNHHLDILPDDLLAAETEHFFGSLVEEADDLVLVDRDHGIQRLLERFVGDALLLFTFCHSAAHFLLRDVDRPGCGRRERRRFVGGCAFPRPPAGRGR